MDNVLLIQRQNHLASVVSWLLFRLILTQGVRTVSLVGHSMGGGLCQLFAAAYPELVDRLLSCSLIVIGGNLIYAS